MNTGKGTPKINLTSLTFGVTPKTVDALFGAKGIVIHDARFDGMSQSAFLRVAIAYAIKHSDAKQINSLSLKCNKPESFESMIKSMGVHA